MRARPLRKGCIGHGMNGMAVRGRSAGDPPRPRCVGENDPADAAGSAGVPGIRIDFRSGLKLQDYPVLRLSFVRILAGCVCDATLRRTRHTESAGPGRAPARRYYNRISNTHIRTLYQTIPQPVCGASARGVGGRASRRASGATAPMRAGSATRRDGWEVGEGVRSPALDTGRPDSGYAT